MVFCYQFVFEHFVFIRVICPKILLKTRTYLVVDFTVLTFFVLSLDSVKLLQSQIPRLEFY